MSRVKFHGILVNRLSSAWHAKLVRCNRNQGKPWEYAQPGINTIKSSKKHGFHASSALTVQRKSGQAFCKHNQCNLMVKSTVGASTCKANSVTIQDSEDITKMMQIGTYKQCAYSSIQANRPNSNKPSQGSLEFCTDKHFDNRTMQKQNSKA